MLRVTFLLWRMYQNLLSRYIYNLVHPSCYIMIMPMHAVVITLCTLLCICVVLAIKATSISLDTRPWVLFGGHVFE